MYKLRQLLSRLLSRCAGSAASGSTGAGTVNTWPCVSFAKFDCRPRLGDRCTSALCHAPFNHVLCRIWLGPIRFIGGGRLVHFAVRLHRLSNRPVSPGACRFGFKVARVSMRRLRSGRDHSTLHATHAPLCREPQLPLPSRFRAGVQPVRLTNSQHHYIVQPAPRIRAHVTFSTLISGAISITYALAVQNLAILLWFCRSAPPCDIGPRDSIPCALAAQSDHTSSRHISNAPRISASLAFMRSMRRVRPAPAGCIHMLLVALRAEQ